jgi:LPS O-antigen subunit length determinant protein (WzzB/FepE family)
MKINLSEEHKKDTSLSWIVLGAFKLAVFSEIIEESRDENGDVIVDVKFTINDREIDIRKLLDKWISQIDREVAKEAKKLVKERFSDKFFKIDNLLEDLEGRLKEEVDRRLADWERELDLEG